MAMRAIELVGRVDEHHQLRIELPHDIPPGTFTVLVQIEEGEEDNWGSMTLRRWAAELGDPREDIYTLEDGEPIIPSTPNRPVSDK